MFLIAGVFLIIVLVVYLASDVDNNPKEMTILKQAIVEALYPRLSDTTSSQPPDMFDAVYILGGNQNSLILKFGIASRRTGQQMTTRHLNDSLFVLTPIP